MFLNLPLLLLILRSKQFEQFNRSSGIGKSETKRLKQRAQQAYSQSRSAHRNRHR